MRVERRRRASPSCSGGLLAAHGLLYQPDDDHQDAAADTAGSDLTDDRADIQAAGSSHRSSLSAATHQRAYDLCSDPAADHADNRVADGSEVILLQCRAGNVAAHGARD